jgi:VCBS repeat protein
MTVGDFNSDGHQDLAIADEEARCIHLRLGNGDGTFRDGGKAVGTTGMPEDLGVADFNADGNEDLAVAAWVAGYAGLGYARGAGNGAFTIGLGFVLPGKARALAVGDFHPDSWSDVATATGDEVVVRLGIDGGAKGTRRVAVGGPARSLGTGDFDGNGIEDIAVLVNGASPKIAVVPGTGSGTFGEPNSVPLAHAGASLAVGDLDADGRDDVVVAIPGNANDFAVTGSLRGRRFAVAAGGRTTLRLPVPKRLRRKAKVSLRLSAVVIDPTGNRRTIGRRV